MSTPQLSLRRRAAAGAAAFALVLAATSAAHSTPSEPISATHLALGDSIAFGYDPSVPKSPATNFVGYPTPVDALVGTVNANAACPGQTTVTFSNRCAYGGTHPLHVAYSSSKQSQLDYALNFLRDNPQTTLVSMTLGGVDVRDCPDKCRTLLLTRLEQVRSNLRHILGSLRTAYGGTVVLAGYYAMNYNNSTETHNVTSVNDVLRQVGREYGAGYADVDTPFRQAATAHRGKTCQTGLIIVWSKGCDVHPTQSGAQLIAEAVAAAAGGGA